jgi:hypothetical protein
MWTFNNKKASKLYNLPKCKEKIIKKYFKELEIGKEYFSFQDEKDKVCPLYPLTTFSE